MTGLASGTLLDVTLTVPYQQSDVIFVYITKHGYSVFAYSVMHDMHFSYYTEPVVT